jgi:hypothetical protein
MSQYDFGTIDPFVNTGEQLADMLNNWRDAIHSWHRGPTRPDYAVPGMMWINDTGGPTNWLVNVYMGPTVGDVAVFGYDTTTGAITMQSGMLLAQAAALPSMRWNATGNAADQKDWRSTVLADGTLKFAPYTDAGVEIAPGIVMTRDGKIIADLSGSSGIPLGTYVGTAPPAGPGPNQLWWKSDTGVLFVYYNDGTSAQWVPCSPPQGPPVPGTILQTARLDTQAIVALPGAPTMPVANRPTTANGMQMFAPLAITPKFASSKLRVRCKAQYNCDQNDVVSIALFRDAGAQSLVASGNWVGGANIMGFAEIDFITPAAAAVATNFSIRAGANSTSGTIWLNGSSASAQHFGGVGNSFFQIEEIA